MQDVQFFALSDSRQVHNKPFTLRITTAQGSTSLLIKISEEIIKRPRNVMRSLQELHEPKDISIKPIGTSFLVAVETKGGKNREPQHYTLLKRNGEYRISTSRAVRTVELIRHKGEVMCLWNLPNGARQPPDEEPMWKPLALQVDKFKEEQESLVERTPKRQVKCWGPTSFDPSLRTDLFAGEPSRKPFEPSEFPWTPLFPELFLCSRAAKFSEDLDALHQADAMFLLR